MKKITLLILSPAEGVAVTVGDFVVVGAFVAVGSGVALGAFVAVGSAVGVGALVGVAAALRVAEAAGLGAGDAVFVPVGDNSEADLLVVGLRAAVASRVGTAGKQPAMIPALAVSSI